MAEREVPLRNDITLDQNPDIPLREAVYLTLRKQILSGGFKPGEHLTEIRLGKLLGTSRTPIREAIRKLEKEGLVTIHRGSGATVEFYVTRSGSTYGGSAGTLGSASKPKSYSFNIS